MVAGGFEGCLGFCRSAPCARWFLGACATPHRPRGGLPQGEKLGSDPDSFQRLGGRLAVPWPNATVAAWRMAWIWSVLRRMVLGFNFAGKSLCKNCALVGANAEVPVRLGSFVQRIHAAQRGRLRIRG